MIVAAVPRMSLHSICVLGCVHENGALLAIPIDIVPDATEVLENNEEVHPRSC